MPNIFIFWIYEKTENQKKKNRTNEDQEGIPLY